MNFLVVFGCVFLLARIDAAAIQRPSKSKPVSGRVGFKGNGPHKGGNGKMQFGEQMTFELEVEGITEERVMNKANVDTNIGIGIKESAVYFNDEMTVRVDCPNTNGEPNCRTNAIKRTNSNSAIFIKSDGGALEIQHSTGSMQDGVVKPDITTVVGAPGNAGNNAANNNAGRKRRSLVDTIQASKVIKVIAWADQGLIDLFKTINNQDEASARSDIQTYLGIIENEMTIYYQSLREYNKNMFVETIATTMDVAVAIVDVVFPAAGSNFDFAVPWTGDGYIYSNKYYYSSADTVSQGILRAFRDYLPSYSTPVAYDHAMFVSGYDLRRNIYFDDEYSQYSDLLGVAWVDSICSVFWKTYGFHSSVVEIDAFFSRIASHELGHGSGMDHDASLGCSDYTNVMSTSIFFPTQDTKDTHYKFSLCSANELNTYTNSLTADDFIDTCLQSPTQVFLDSFCYGFTGHNYDFNKTCQLEFGPSSYRYPEETGSTKETRLQQGYVEQCIVDASGVLPFKCYNPSGTYYSYTLAPDGTNCVSPTGILDPSYVCYQGECVNNLTLCDSPETTTTTTTTTTAAPTTTTTTPTTTTTTPTTTTTAPTTTTAAPTTTTAAPTTTTAAPTTTTAAPTTTTTAPTTTTTASSSCPCDNDQCCSGLDQASCEACTTCKWKNNGSCTLQNAKNSRNTGK